jgi:hypothetical protein
MQARAFLIIVFCATLAMVGAIVATNWLVDPYGIRDGRSIPSLYGQNESAGAFLRNASLVAVTMPRTVILGTSRAGGLSADHNAFSASDRPVLNVALGAASIQQMHEMLVHAHATSGLRKAIVGLDLEAFIEPGRADFDPAALKGNRHTEPAPLVRMRTLLSRDMWLASIERELAAVLDPSSSAQHRHGDATQSRLQALQGQRGLIWITEFNNFYARLPYLFPSDMATARWAADPRRAAATQAFREMLDYARAQRIDLHLFISPVHARYLDWYAHVGWWALFEHWKRALAATITAEASATPGRTPFVLWDFSGFHDIAIEQVPQYGDLESRMRWYLDTSHYSRAAGNLILDRILRSADNNVSSLPRATLEAATVERHIDTLKDDAARYRTAHRSETDNVAEMVRFLRRVARSPRTAASR